MKTMLCTLLFVVLSLNLDAVEKPALSLSWTPQVSGSSASIRGIKAIDERHAWLCGANGTLSKTTDGGAHWVSLKAPGAGDLDFRDIEAFDGETAWLMSAGVGKKSFIYKTVDGGKSWQVVYNMEHEKGFLNTINFLNPKQGVAVSDPIDDRLFVLSTPDGGASWNRIPPDLLPAMKDDEYLFAASGSCIASYGTNHLWVATGGAVARVFRTENGGKDWAVFGTPMTSGSSSKGIFSIAFLNTRNGVIVGGDYTKEKEGGSCVAWTEDGGITWKQPEHAKKMAFRSSVAWLTHNKKILALAVGPAGSSYSLDLGRSWTHFPGNFHTLSVGNSSSAIWAAGADGRVARLTIQ